MSEIEIADFYYWYWAHNKKGETIHFPDNNTYEIGSIVDYNGENVTIDDYAVEPVFAN